MEVYAEEREDSPEEPQKVKYPRIKHVPPTTRMKIKKLTKKHRKELEKQLAEKRKMRYSFER